MKLVHTDAFDEALRLMGNGGPFLFITGRAGTGKSTLLTHFRETTTLDAPVLAPTGVAALNVQGETIHRFFRFAPGITVKEARKAGSSSKDADLYRKIDLLIIDEISMVRADLLDCIDQFLQAARKQRKPFGGLRIVAIGDLYQLPPVVTSSERAAFSELYKSPYFFGSHVIEQLLSEQSVSFIELERVFRQSDPSFITLLNGVRNRTITEDELCALNTRTRAQLDKSAIVLTSTNDAANELNNDCLSRLRAKTHTWNGTFRGEFPEREAPADPVLTLRIGARVMCVANDTSGRFVNGSLGWVRGFETNEEEIDMVEEEDGDEADSSVIVELDEGGLVSIEPHTWTIYRSTYDRATKHLDQERMGSFTQIPLRLAWAITVHKSQGKTFDQVTVDLGKGAFAAGQTYVALSRCRSFEGLALVKPVTAKDVRLDYAVVKFLTSLQYQLSRNAQPPEEKMRLLKEAISSSTRLQMTYLKGKDEKSKRTILPLAIEESEYAGHAFLALRAWCDLRKQERTFNVERILEIRPVGGDSDEKQKGHATKKKPSR